MKDKIPYRGWYPIHTACAFGASDRVLGAILVGILCLMEMGSNEPGSTKAGVDFIDALGRSPLYIAAKCGNLSHIYLMTSPLLFNTLQRSAPSLYAITSRALSQISAIHCAIAHGSNELLHVLLDKFPLATEVSAYPSISAIRHMLDHLQEKNLDNKPVIWPLLESTICEDSDGKLFLTSTSNALDEYGVLSNLVMSPLALAVAMGDTEIMKMLLDAGATDDKYLALRIAIFLQHHEIAKTMLTVSDFSYICEGNGKKLFTFTLSVDQLSSFKEIYLQKNFLTSIPLALFQIPGLKILDVSYNHLTELPNVTSESGHLNCPSLMSLDISNNNFFSLPSVLWEFPYLSHLHAQHNAISKVEPPLKCSAKLEEINISHNELNTVPFCVFYSKTVNISFNKLVELPASLWSLKTLKALNIASNLIQRITFPKNLCYFKLNNTPSFTSKGMRTLTTDGRNTVITHTAKNQHGGLLKLNLANNKLTSLPEDLACFAYCLEDLNISGNNIRTLFVCSLPPYLKQITAKECSLEYFGTACSEAATHTSHCYHRNHLSLKKLTVLKLNKNKLTVFYLKSRAEKSLKFPELEFLDLSYNDLHGTLDDSIKHQRCLSVLYLSGNPKLTELPLELSYLGDTLNALLLDNLPGLVDPPKEYHSVPIKRLLSYLKSRLKR